MSGGNLIFTMTMTTPTAIVMMALPKKDNETQGAAAVLLAIPLVRDRR